MVKFPVRFTLYRDDKRLCYRQYILEYVDEIDPVRAYKDMQVYSKLANRMDVDIVYTDPYDNLKIRLIPVHRICNEDLTKLKK